MSFLNKALLIIFNDYLFHIIFVTFCRLENVVPMLANYGGRYRRRRRCFLGNLFISFVTLLCCIVRRTTCKKGKISGSRWSFLLVLNLTFLLFFSSRKGHRLPMTVPFFSLPWKYRIIKLKILRIFLMVPPKETFFLFTKNFKLKQTDRLRKKLLKQKNSDILALKRKHSW